jgi:pectate lyase
MSLARSRCGYFLLCAALTSTSCGVSDGPDGPDGLDRSDLPDGVAESQVVAAATPCSVPSFIAGAPSPAGFASLNGGTTGGGAATGQLVTTLAQLNTAAKGTTAAVIFVSGDLGQGTATIGSNKTIIGCSGTNPTLRGHVGLSSSANVIIRNLNVVGFNCRPPDVDTGNGGECQNGQDAITVQKSHNIWFDHDAISDGSDGNLDINHGSDFITISNTKFFYSSARSDPNDTGAAGHRFSNLIGGSDSNGSEDAGKLNITWVHDWWAQNVVERQARIRFGKNHFYNNLWTSTGNNYCIGVGVGANILTQNNAFINVRTPLNTTSFVNASIAASAIKSTGNVLTGTSGNAAVDLNAGSVFTPPYAFTLGSGSTTQAFVQANAGPK